MDLLRDATHVFCGDLSGLRESGVARGMQVLDKLSAGPSALDPARHRRLRWRYWKRERELEAAVPEYEIGPRWPRSGRIALWTSIGVIDQLFYWNAVERLAGLELWRIDARHPKVPIDGVGTLPEQFVVYSAQGGRRVGVREVSQARRRWEAFASGELRDLSRMLPGEPVARQWLHDSLPQKSQHLRLSRLDQTLLRPFSTLRPPIDSVRAWSDIIHSFGDLFVLTRLRRWETRGALVSVPLGAMGPSPWKNRELQLTPLGLRLLRGMRSLDEAPPMFIGGHEAYGPRSWLLTSSGSLRRA
jgi:hypothetical protein